MTDDARLESLPGDEPLDPAAAAATDPPALVTEDAATASDAELLALIDRLAVLLERSDLSELEVEAGRTGLVLRKPVAVAPGPTGSAATSTAEPAAASASDGDGAAPAASRPAVTAPLTGIFYASPAPGSAPYVQVGGEVAVGQVIGLIEAMKLFNEIKSDLAGRVVKVVAESGALVKARQPLVEVEPL